MEKKTKDVYEEPQMNVVELETGNVICLSGGAPEMGEGPQD